MRTSVMNDGGVLGFAYLPLRKMGPNDLTGNVRACGVCGSEHAMQRLEVLENMPAYAQEQGTPIEECPAYNMGHEFVVEVTDCGVGVTEFKLGDLVSVVREPRGYAEQAVVQAKHCARVSPDLDPWKLGLIEQAMCANASVRLLTPELGDTVVVLGATGLIGWFVTELCVLRGAGNVIVTGRRDDVLARLSHLPRVRTVNTRYQELADVVFETTGRHDVDVVFECIGEEQPLRDAQALLGARKRYGVLGYHQSQGGERTVNYGDRNRRGIGEVTCHFPPEVLYTEIKPAHEQVIKLMETGLLNGPPQDAILRVPLNDIHRAFDPEVVKRAGIVKAVVEP